jgi:hypothetical protein
MKFALTNFYQSRGLEFEAATPHELRLKTSAAISEAPWRWKTRKNPITKSLLAVRWQDEWLMIAPPGVASWTTSVTLEPHLLSRETADNLFFSARAALEKRTWFEKMLAGLAGFAVADAPEDIPS